MDKTIEEKSTIAGEEYRLRLPESGHAALAYNSGGRHVGGVNLKSAGVEASYIYTKSGRDYTPFATRDEGIERLKARLQAEAAQ